MLSELEGYSEIKFEQKSFGAFHRKFPKFRSFPQICFLSKMAMSRKEILKELVFQINFFCLEYVLKHSAASSRKKLENVFEKCKSSGIVHRHAISSKNDNVPEKSHQRIFFSKSTFSVRNTYLRFWIAFEEEKKVSIFLNFRNRPD